jgi:type IX secretion system PorP/SprF family membrane protein
MKRVLYILALAAGIIPVSVQSQDFHITQYDMFPMYMNPALTGNYLGEEGDYRIHTLYRSQWRMLAAKPFSTFGAGYDAKYQKFGLGGYILNNRSGVANFNTMNVQLSGSYFITDPKQSPHLLNTGLQMGIFYKFFNPNKLVFDSQYDYSTGEYNSAINSGENFQRTSMVKFDANFGVFYKYRDNNKKYWPFVGVAVYHLSLPKENFTDKASKVPMRFNIQTGCDFKVDEKWKITPTILYMNQAKASEINVGVLANYKLNDNKEVNYDLVFGANYRVQDAVMIQAGVKKNNILLRMSYDVNVSYLNSYTSGRGAFEITLQITGKKGEPLFKGVSQF